MKKKLNKFAKKLVSEVRKDRELTRENT